MHGVFIGFLPFGFSLVLFQSDRKILAKLAVIFVYPLVTASGIKIR
jgi:hypothetical protein